MGAINELRNTATGIKILRAWLGTAAEPVPLRLAEMRAWVCEYCPENQQPGWWDRVKDKIAETMRLWLEAKNQIGLRVSNEDKLGVCRVCGCCNRLSVHAPLAHIVTHMTPAQKAATPRSCWKLATNL